MYPKVMEAKSKSDGSMNWCQAFAEAFRLQLTGRKGDRHKVQPNIKRPQHISSTHKEGESDVPSLAGSHSGVDHEVRRWTQKARAVRKSEVYFTSILETINATD